MRRGSLLWLALLLAGCSGGRSGDPAPPEDPRKQRLAEFWTTFRQANQLRVREDYEGAAAAYRKCLAINPDHEESLFYLGASLEHLGRADQAAEAYERLLELNPASSRALAQLGRLLASSRAETRIDFARARALIQRLRELNPEQAGVYLQLGLLDLREGRHAAALEQFRIAARFGAAEGHYWAACVLSLEGEPDEARAHLDRVLESRAREQRIARAGARAEGDSGDPRRQAAAPLERAAAASVKLLERLDARPRLELDDCFALSP